MSVIAILSITPVRAADEAAKPTIHICGIRVVGTGFKDKESEQQPFNQPQGTTLAILVRQPSGELIGFDEQESVLSAFTNDKGDSLLDKKESFDEGFGSFPQVSKDGKAAIIELSAKRLPGKGARELRAKGSLAFKTGTQKKTAVEKAVALKKGTTFSVGPIEITIKQTGKPQWGDEPLEVTFEMGKAGDSLAGVRFLDDKGTPIKSSASSSASMRLAGMVKLNKSYRLARQVETATVEVTYWTDMKTVRVPFDLTVGLGSVE